MVAAILSLPRTVTAETLDALAAYDPQAMRSRRDLRRIHRIMGTRNTVLHALRGLTARHRKPAPLRVLELGCGDGSLMLSVARALAPEWPTVTLTLLDAQPLIQRDTVKDYAALGWTAAAFEVPADLLADWRSLGLRGGAARAEWAARLADRPADRQPAAYHPYWSRRHGRWRVCDGGRNGTAAPQSCTRLVGMRSGRLDCLRTLVCPGHRRAAVAAR